MAKLLNFSEFMNKKVNTDDWEAPDKVIEPDKNDWHPQEQWELFKKKRDGNFAKKLPNSVIRLDNY